MTLTLSRVSRDGVSYVVRDGTNDAALVMGILGTDEYGLSHLPPLEGWAIDIGAHIGIVTIALAANHPRLRIVAVEALPENVEVLRDAVAANGLGERVEVLAAAAAASGIVSVDMSYGWTWSENQPDAYMVDNRFIGGMVPANASSTTIACPAISLIDILARYEIERVALLKIDCEGCEWGFLASPAVDRVDRIVGEYHDRPFSDIAALLGATHEVTHLSGDNIGIFTAVHR